MTAPFASPPHHPYEKKIYDTVNAMLTDVQTILNKLTLKPNDGNLAPTNGMIGRLQALLQELKNGSPNQTTHDKNIEGILYAIAQICDQFNIFGQSPATPAYPQPTGGTHQDRVLRLFTKIDSICRDIFHILEPGTILYQRSQLAASATLTTLLRWRRTPRWLSNRSAFTSCPCT